jgi:hypothetical protein
MQEPDPLRVARSRCCFTRINSRMTLQTTTNGKTEYGRLQLRQNSERPARLGLGRPVDSTAHGTDGGRRGQAASSTRRVPVEFNEGQIEALK